MSEGIYKTPPKTSDSPYFTIGSAETNGMRSFLVEQIDGLSGVRVFTNQQSANNFRDNQHPGLTVNDWDSINQLTLQVQNRGTDIPMLHIQRVDGTFESVSVNDIL